jgi:hypothetical protein
MANPQRVNSLFDQASHQEVVLTIGAQFFRLTELLLTRRDYFMTRRWLAFLPLALALAGSAVLPATASAAGHDDPSAAACTQDTQEVTDLTTAVTNLGTALQATPPDPTKVSQVSGDLFTAVTAAQTAGCLPALPASPPADPAPQDATDCAADTVKLLSATLDEVAAGTATPPDATALVTAATGLATAITAINTDTCLPVSLPVPTVPGAPAVPPVPPVPPVPSQP